MWPSVLQLKHLFYLYFLSFKCTLIPPCGKLYADLNLFRSMGILFNFFLIFLLSRKVKYYGIDSKYGLYINAFV